MKASIYLIVLVALLLGACSKSPSTAKTTLATPVQGMRADEVMAAHSVASEVLPARAIHKNDPGLEALDKQMASLVSGLDSRTQLLMSAQAQTPASGSKAATLQQELDSNAANLNSILASARASVDNVGDTQKRVAGMPAESLQAGLRASMDRIRNQLNDIFRAPTAQAIPEIAALRSRLILAPLHTNGRAAPTISVRTIHP